VGLFGGGGKSRDELIAEAQELNDQPEQEEKKDEVSTGNQKIDIELTKIEGRIQGLDEVRKSSSERFSRVAEQIGELRGMIVDTNKAMSKVEVSATKAVDLVESVHPEKLMIDVRKQDGKIEALRASIESNEAIMKDIMLEMKKMRGKMNLYKGVEQVMEMNDEIKKELSTIKRVEATIESHADKVETIFIEVNKKFGDFDKFNSIAKDLDKSFKKMSSDFEKLRTKTETKQDRKEFIDMLDRFNEFEKHTTNLLKLLDERNKTVKDDLQARFDKLVLQYKAKLDSMRPSKKLATVPKEEDPSSGEDGPGADVKPSRFKAWFTRTKPPEEEQEEIFPEEEEQEVKQPEPSDETSKEKVVPSDDQEPESATKEKSLPEDPQPDIVEREEPAEEKKS